MSKLLSLKMREEVFRETEEILQHLRKPRNAYLNEAIDLYNKLEAVPHLEAESPQGSPAAAQPRTLD